MSFNTNPANAVTYITDPSASFLKVPVRVINNLNVPVHKISENSFFNDDFFWLEIENDSEQDKVINKLKNIENIQILKDLNDVKKIIFVKNKILNIVI